MFGNNNQIEMAQRVAELVLATPGIARSDIKDGLVAMQRRAGRALDCSDNTIYRWIEKAIESDWLRREGNTAGARYYPTDSLRLQWARRQVSRKKAERPLVRYNEDFLGDYIPNKTFYLTAGHRDRLANRCPIGSAPLERLGDHDVSLFLCDLAYQSSRLEGNEYDFANTIALLDHRIAKDGGKQEDRIMILNHHDAVRFIIDHVPRQDAAEDEKQAGINVRCNDLLSLHAILSADLMRNPAHCGALRKSNVEIGGSTYLPPDIPDRIRDFFDRVIAKAAAIENPWEQAVFLNVHLPYVQPFEDCNKRVARVACNIPLLRSGVTPMSWTDVPRKDYTDAMISVYELNDTLLLADIFTDGYLRSCERFELMSRTQDPDPLVMQYRYEIRQAIRHRILDDHDGVPTTVAPEKAADFIRYVEQQLEALLANPLQAARFGFRANDVLAYAERNRPETARERERAA